MVRICALFGGKAPAFPKGASVKATSSVASDSRSCTDMDLLDPCEIPVVRVDMCSLLISIRFRAQ